MLLALSHDINAVFKKHHMEVSEIFQHRGLPVVSKWQIEDLRQMRGSVSFDLELTRTPIEYRGRRARFVFNGTIYEIDLDELPELDEESCDIYVYESGWRQLSIAGEHFYKLCVYRRGWAPTLMINGITMHSVLENPLDVTKRKVKYVRGRVFECCTGLGYTAIESLARGAKYVLTVEADPNVLLLASYNPYSRGLFGDRIDVELCDVMDFVKALRGASFDYIIHDPPRLSHSTQALYSEQLYTEYKRIVRRGGGLFHYTGSTGSKYRGISVWKGVAERLRYSGFVVERVERGFGVYARSK
ncbi:predicted methyltransferase [Thermoproteus tenax Kra 1]|uniref:Predicted methyltransferase n=2 Tax=Thermoproteus tenax TaxID=2271 RepID=G4RL82_THETK|nr:predicted methyltransferase [Thermoproteus tenax Kra 1]